MPRAYLVQILGDSCLEQAVPDQQTESIRFDPTVFAGPLSPDVRKRLTRLTTVGQNRAEIRSGRSQMGIELEGGPERLERLNGLPKGLERDSSILLGSGGIGPQLEGVGESLDRRRNAPDGVSVPPHDRNRRSAGGEHRNEARRRRHQAMREENHPDAG